MEMNNAIEVDASMDDVWEAFGDVERLAPCLPGAQLTEVEGEEYRGVVKVKVGPINAQYKGQATFLERDRDAQKVVIKAEGRETRGQGNANAVITATLEAVSEERTRVSVSTDLTITGKVAQIGRNLIPDVSGKLMEQFAENLGEMLSDGNPDNGASAEPDADGTAAGVPRDLSAAAQGSRMVNAPEAEPVDLMGVAGAPIAKRVAPVVGVIILLWIIKKLLGSKDED